MSNSNQFFLNKDEPIKLIKPIRMDGSSVGFIRLHNAHDGEFDKIKEKEYREKYPPDPDYWDAKINCIHRYD